MLDLDQAIRERHSTRCFCPNGAAGLVNGARLGPVCAIELQNPALAYGVRIWSIPGPPRRALIDEAQRRPPNIPPLPASFQHFRNELGAQSTVRWESREDTARHAAAVLRNWEFFRAPVAGIVCMHRDLGPADALSVGMFLQTLLLALTERGLGSCLDISISRYPKIVRAQLAIPTELSILCGLAIDYPDPEFPANKLHIAREPIGENMVFLDKV